MKKTISVKLLPSNQEAEVLRLTIQEYIAAVNEISGWMYTFNECGKLTSRHVLQSLPSALKNQAIRDARSIFIKYRTGKVDRFPLLRKPVAIWNNQNYSFDENHIAIPVWNNGKSTKITINGCLVDAQLSDMQKYKLGTLRITQKSGKWIAQISVEIPLPDAVQGDTMGVDLGLKCPAVCYTDTGAVKFIGNGRRNKQLRRRFASKRKKLQKMGKNSAIHKLGNKENRIMGDIDHKISREIVDFAIAHSCGTIKMEKLQSIRQQARKSRKNNRSLHSWSFYRLASFIEYKAALAGINIEYVNPAYTSQTCPVCGTLNHADDRDYRCKCGFHKHRDIVGAMNILAA